MGDCLVSEKFILSREEVIFVYMKKFTKAHVMLFTRKFQKLVQYLQYQMYTSKDYKNT
jgi:hypothetical protein